MSRLDLLRIVLSCMLTDELFNFEKGYKPLKNALSVLCFKYVDIDHIYDNTTCERINITLNYPFEDPPYESFMRIQLKRTSHELGLYNDFLIVC